MKTLGIMPGYRGGFALINAGDSNTCQFLPRLGDQVNVAPLGELLDEHRPHVAIQRPAFNFGGDRCPECGQVERPIPPSSVRKIAQSYGLLLGAVWSRGLTLVEVRRSVWMRTIMIDTNRSLSEIETAMFRIHDWADTRPGRCTSPQDGLVSALAIAEYMRRMQQERGALADIESAAL